MNSAPPLREDNAGDIATSGATKNPQSQQTCRVIDVTSPADFNQIISSYPAETLLVIYFMASWAEPCKHMSTAIETLASTYTATSPPKISFLRIDADDISDLAEQYDVTAVPYLVLQKNGQVLDSITSSDISTVRTTVEKHAGRADGNPGKFGLPPVQQVSKPVGEQSTGKDLSSYAPGPNDQATAPQYSSGQVQDDAASKDELNSRLSELVKAAPVMLFMKGTPSAPQCGFSRQTVALLREKGIRYGFFNILADDDVRQGLKEFSDWPTFPQVYCDGELVGGLDIVSLRIPIY